MERSTIAAVIADILMVSCGDITDFEGDAIVNAANSGLMGGGGVDGAIHRAGGPAILEECRRLRRSQFPQGLPVGAAAVTGAGNLKVRSIIHTVAPVWRGGEARERELLAACYRSTLQEASRLHLRSIAYPAIGTGIYRFTKTEAAGIAIEAIAEHCSQATYPTHIAYILFSEADAQLFNEVRATYDVA